MSSIIIDRKYIGFVSARLRNFQHKGNGTASFTHECERSDSRKRRGYFLQYKDRMVYKCHNCGESGSFSTFLKHLDANLYSEYVLECFREGVYGLTKDTDPEPVTTKTIILDGVFNGLTSFMNLDSNHHAFKPLMRRKIPLDKIRQMYLAPKFFKWATQFDSVFGTFKDDHPRVVIPYYNVNNKLIGFACRAYGKETPKYIQLRLDKNAEFIYGADKIDESKRIYAVEGQIDSMFIENCVGVGNANYDTPYINRHKDNITIIPDNDFRRNLQVCKQLAKVIDKGFSVCFLPDHWRKDINDIIKSGIPQSELMHYIHANTKKDLSAKLELSLERRC